MEEMTQEQRDEAQREKIASQKNDLFKALVWHVILAAAVALGFYFVTLW